MKPNNSEIAANIARRFGVYKCQECSIALQNEFIFHRIHGRRLELRAINVGERSFIVMKDPTHKLPFQLEKGYPISDSGRHFGVEVNAYVYDNIFRQGILLTRWASQFECISSKFEIYIVEEF